MDVSGEPHSHSILEPTSIIKGKYASQLVASLPPSLSPSLSRSPKIKFVQEIYQILGNDLDEFLKFCDMNTNWTINGPPVLSKCKAWVGKQGIKDFFNLLSSMWKFDSQSPMPMEFYECDGNVIVLGHESGTIIKTHERFYNRFTHVWTVDEASRKVMEMREWLCFYHNCEEVPPMQFHDQSTSLNTTNTNK